MTTESHVAVGPSSTTFVGPDATKLFQVTVIQKAIEFYLNTGMKVNRAYTPTAMRDFATSITKKPYKRTELAKASADLRVWIEAMKSAIPVNHETPIDG